MLPLFHAHSGIRYLVIFFGIISIIYFLYGLFTKKEYDRTDKIFSLVFTIILDVEILIGIILYIISEYPPHVTTHIIFMITALLSAHVLTILNKKRKKSNYYLAISAVIVPLLLIWAGISHLTFSVFAGSS